MKLQRVLITLTAINLVLFTVQLTSMFTNKVEAADSILRGSGIEIVDADGRLRAQLKVEPENTQFEMPDGTTGYPDTVIFRLITPDGKPRVKLTTSVEASGLMLVGDSDDTQSILAADGSESTLKLRNNEATQQLVTPLPNN